MFRNISESCKQTELRHFGFIQGMLCIETDSFHRMRHVFATTYADMHVVYTMNK